MNMTPKNDSPAGKQSAGKTLSARQSDELIDILQGRFEMHMHRHPDMAWSKVSARLRKSPGKLWTLHQMEITGGEPDVISINKAGDWLYADCSAETPKGRRSLCYDGAALESRKEHKPKDSAMEMARKMGVELLTEEQYRRLQELGEFDLKTSSWLLTPPRIRKLGGAIFGDRRFDTVFIYHNGAESYYASRGFRGALAL